MIVAEAAATEQKMAMTTTTETSVGKAVRERTQDEATCRQAALSNIL